MTGVPALAANREAGAARGYLAAGSPLSALSAAAAAVKLDPGRAVYWNWLGIATESLQHWDEAITSYGEAVARSDYVATYSMNVARTKAELGLARTDTAIKSEAFDEARRALAIDPLDPVTNRSFAEIALLLGGCDDAFQSTLDAYSLSGADRRFAVGLSAAAACVNDVDRARIGALATLAVGDTSEIRAALAVLFLRAGDIESARSNALRALELDSSSASALQVLDSIGR
jgi:tetratricopeptide (TPR) repeat protein